MLHCVTLLNVILQGFALPDVHRRQVCLMQRVVGRSVFLLDALELSASGVPAQCAAKRISYDIDNLIKALTWGAGYGD